ncbi:hypothetical protein TgHK011_001336 [Trichoderma gracile]|nr:hypothetical protein TgHK011_001336 [Trichoderma gracile]
MAKFRHSWDSPKHKPTRPDLRVLVRTLRRGTYCFRRFRFDPTGEAYIPSPECTNNVKSEVVSKDPGH